MIQRMRYHLSSATPTQRCLLAIFLNTPFAVAFICVQSLALFVDDWRIYLNPNHIIAVDLLQMLCLSVQWFLAWKLWPQRHSREPIPNLYLLVAVYVCISFAAEAYLGGNLTYPTSMVIISIIPIGFLILDLRSVAWAVVLAVAFIVFNDVMILSQKISYAPGYSPAAFAGGEQLFMPELLRTVLVYTHFISYVVIFWILFDQFEYHRRLLTETSQKDALTGLSNRRYFMERLQARCDDPSPSGVGQCLALLDADHFKKINDTYGHAVGDQVLRGIAELLASSMRCSDDELGRIGGEEFAILLPNTAVHDAKAVCERIQAELSNRTFSCATDRFQVTLSFGLVEGRGVDAEALLKEADRLLYEAKIKGRNTIVIAQNPVTQPVRERHRLGIDTDLTAQSTDMTVPA